MKSKVTLEKQSNSQRILQSHNICIDYPSYHRDSVMS